MLENVWFIAAVGMGLALIGGAVLQTLRGSLSPPPRADACGCVKAGR